MAALPDVSVVLSCYNQGRWVEEALGSIAAQTHRPRQLIVADDASDDDSPDRIRRWLDRHWPDATFVHHTTNTGLPRMLNEVVPRADSALFVQFAADDRMVPHRLEREAAALVAAGPRVGLVYSDMTLIGEDGRPMGLQYYDYGPTPVEGDVFLAMLEASVPASPTVMVRREALAAVGPYDESLVYEDWDLWLRMSRLVEFAFVPEALVEYRRVEGSLSRSEEYRRTFGESTIRVLRKHLGVSRAGDRIIAGRIGRTALELYRKGRDPAPTATDLRFAMRRRPTPRGLAGLALAQVGIEGPTVVRAAARLRRTMSRQ
jgi:glycosyltransferase involved in cell wall biosynthesis